MLAPNGYLHAAAVVGLADTAAGYACFAHLPEGASSFTTIELKCNFIGTVTSGSVECTATAAHLGQTTQVWDAVVKSAAAARPLALFRCTPHPVATGRSGCHLIGRLAPRAGAAPWWAAFSAIAASWTKAWATSTRLEGAACVKAAIGDFKSSISRGPRSHARHGGGGGAGKCRLNTVRWPGALRTEAVPRCNTMIERTIARPRPEPEAESWRDGSAR